MHAQLRPIEDAINGLLFPSETDSPFEPLEFDEQPTIDKLRELAGADETVAVSTLSLEDLFRNAKRTHAGDGQREKDRAERFINLEKILHRELESIAVYRMGNTQVHVFIIGRSRGGAWTGLRTLVVET